uniref:Uncharacterized protein n=1 Tax=mine drainage metagenome TaxID=410659 RepID=E6PHT2_9ZZZZ
MRAKRKLGKGRMTPATVAAVLAEIEAFGRGERDGALSWDRLVEFSGFSNVALWKKVPIKDAFQRVKQQARADATPAIKPRKTIDERIIRLQSMTDDLRSLVRSYDELWALYEYNMHRMGLDPDELRRPLDGVHRERVRSGGSKLRG